MVHMVDVTGSTFVSGLFFDDPVPIFIDCMGAKIGEIREIAEMAVGYDATVVLYTDYSAKKITKIPSECNVIDINVPAGRSQFVTWAMSWTSKYCSVTIDKASAETIYGMADNETDRSKLVIHFGSLGIIEPGSSASASKFNVWDLVTPIVTGDPRSCLALLNAARVSKISVPEIVAALSSYFSNMIVVGDPAADHSDLVKNDYYHKKNIASVENKEAFTAGVAEMTASLDYPSLLLAVTKMASSARR